MNAPLSRPAARPKPAAPGRLESYFLRHAQAFFYSLGQLTRTPLSSLMTAAVIGIALALPAGLHLLLQNAQAVSGGWDGATQISLFLREEVEAARAGRLAERLRARADIKEVHYISPERALEEFKQLSGFGEALDALQDNPLPAVLVIHPALGGGADTTEALRAELAAQPEVELAQLDMQWVKRLYAMMNTVGRAVLVLGVLLGLAVILVVGNTIRLAIENRREEIVVMKLIGGTDAFIRRPFLYTGFWYGLGGGVIGLLLVSAALLALSGPVQALAGLYASDFRLHALDLRTVLLLLGTGTALGLLGSWLAVGRHLRAIEPT